ncbi:hypothetical protein T484DRAFT_1846724 [Baffinella frigidus]|nr:hypothetical protein T484DRAFT_1846724 [Cryptophyta sp. CCMP2293]
MSGRNSPCWEFLTYGVNALATSRSSSPAHDDEPGKHDATPASSAAPPEEALRLPRGLARRLTSPARIDESLEPTTASSRLADCVDVAPYTTPEQVQAMEDERRASLLHHVQMMAEQAAMPCITPEQAQAIQDERRSSVLNAIDEMETMVDTRAVFIGQQSFDAPISFGRASSPTETADPTTAASQTNAFGKREHHSLEEDVDLERLGNRVLQDINAAVKHRTDPYTAESESDSEHGQASGGAATAFPVLFQAPPPPPPVVAPAALLSPAIEDTLLLAPAMAEDPPPLAFVPDAVAVAFPAAPHSFPATSSAVPAVPTNPPHAALLPPSMDDPLRLAPAIFLAPPPPLLAPATIVQAPGAPLMARGAPVMAPDIVHAPAAPLLAPAIAQAPPPPPLALGAPAMATAIMQAPPPPLLDLGTPLMAPVIIVQAPTAPLLAPAPPLLAPGAAPLVGAPLLDLAAAVRCVGDIVEVVAANKAAQTPEAARVEEAQWAQSVEFLARTYGGYPRAKAKTNAVKRRIAVEKMDMVKQRIVIENMDMVLSKTACLEGEFLGSGRMVVDLIPITIPGDTSGVQRGIIQIFFPDDTSGVQRNNLRINDTASRYATIRVLQASD